jgi:nucleotide-binding universal stress UspA family protein
MRIAVATDFSQQAERAHQAAIALARKLGASLALIHAVEPLPPEVLDREQEETARRRLDPLSAADSALGLNVDAVVAVGYAEEVIAKVAARAAADLIVIGTHGRRAPIRWLLGSTAERTLQASEIPVLVVADGSDVLAAWAAGSRPLHITVALESAVPAEAILTLARQLHAAGGCELSFVHVASRALLGGRLPELLEQACAKWLAPLGARLHIIPDGDSLADAIAKFVSQAYSDLTIVGIHTRWELDASRTAELARSLLHRRIGPVIGVPLGAAIPGIFEAPRLETILVATDLSELGNRAVAHAYAIARGGSVTLLYVHVMPEGLAVPLDPDERARLQLQLLAQVPPSARARGIETNVVIVEGAKPAQAIVDSATRLGCDLICIGSHGRSVLGRVILGSVAHEVLHLFPKPVLLVR